MKKHFYNFRVGLLSMLAAMVITSLTSCHDHEDGEEEPILHRNYIQGKLNNHDIAIDDINANILMDKSDYEFSSGNQTDIPAWFDWEVKLLETEDTVITMYLHINDVERTNEIIYSPNDEDPIKTKSTCYATVEDLKNKTTSIYHPTHPAPISVSWETFMITTEKNATTKEYNYKMEYTGRRWPGIEGSLYGSFTCDDASKSPLKIKLKFMLY